MLCYGVSFLYLSTNGVKDSGSKVVCSTLIVTPALPSPTRRGGRRGGSQYLLAISRVWEAVGEIGNIVDMHSLYYVKSMTYFSSLCTLVSRNR